MLIFSSMKYQNQVSGDLSDSLINLYDKRVANLSECKPFTRLELY